MKSRCVRQIRVLETVPPPILIDLNSELKISFAKMEIIEYGSNEIYCKYYHSSVSVVTGELLPTSRYFIILYVLNS